MARRQILILLLLAGWISVSCGVVPRETQPPVRTTTTETDSTPSFTTSSTDEEKSDITEDSLSTPPPARAVSSLNEVRVSLMQAYREWKGTPYKLGGSSKKGVDCSLFIHSIFDNYFNIDLPTNTRAQLNAGDGIRRAGIRTGDLLFFKTGRKTLHVGVAVNHGEFLHASTTNGVTISKLGNSYWRNRFLAARRIF